MVTLQGVQGHTGLTHPFNFFDIWALWHSELSTRVPECQKITNDVFDQYGPECIGRLIFATVIKMCETERVNQSFECMCCKIMFFLCTVA